VVDILDLGFFFIVKALHLLGEFRDLGNQFTNNIELTLSFLELQVDHLDLFFFFADFLFTVLKNLFLNVGLLVKDTQLVIAVNQLDTHVVSALTSLLVLINQIIHFLLERINDQVKLIRLVNLLTDDVLLLFEFVLILV